MYAVFQLTGFQYTAEEGTVLKVPLQAAEEGSQLDIGEVLMINDGEKSLVGTPFVEDARIEAEVLSHGKADKVLVFKFKRRKKYRRTTGHRQDYSEIKINKIISPQG